MNTRTRAHVAFRCRFPSSKSPIRPVTAVDRAPFPGETRGLLCSSDLELVRWTHVGSVRTSAGSGSGRIRALCNFKIACVFVAGTPEQKLRLKDVGGVAGGG